MELFSDGVFAIILTLLVLDLKVPGHAGLAGLRDATPGLLVHAGAFFVIGMAWITHHQFLEHVERVGRSMLGWNLLILFWVTLVPFGARIAAESPGDGLGAAIMAGSITMATLFTLIMVQAGSFTSAVHDPAMAAFRRRRARGFAAYILLGCGMTAACFASAWFGYVFLSLGLAVFVVRPVSEAIEREGVAAG